MSDVAIGVDVGGTKALALVVARDGRVLGEARAATPTTPPERREKRPPRR